MIQQSQEQLRQWLERAAPGERVYLIGAGGCGMSGLGHLFLDIGFKVFGSDIQNNIEAEELRARGAVIHQGHDAAHLDEAQPSLVVYSSAVKPENPELRRAVENGLPVARRAVALAALCSRQRGVCVAGMHGKTTTSAWLAWCLEQIGADASYAIGWRMLQLKPHARYKTTGVSQPPWFVVEADESDGTLGQYRPHFAIVLNLDEEHLDYFGDFETICRQFKQFAARAQGGVVYCRDDERLSELLSGVAGAVSYGFHPLADYRLEARLCRRPPGPAEKVSDNHEAIPACFEVWHERRRLGEFQTVLRGEHNISNAGAVIATLHQMGYTAQQIAPAVASFLGAARRQEELYRDGRFRVFDDYGHHPREIRATLRAMRAMKPRRLLVAFQPHRYTRTRDLLEDFAKSLAEADRLWLMEIYPASEPAIPGINSELLAKAVRKHGKAAEVVACPEELSCRVREVMQPGDLALFLGAGADITIAGHALARKLREERAGDAAIVRPVEAAG